MLERFQTPETLANAGAEKFLTLSQIAIDAHGQFFVVLSGGSTPRLTYERLATPAMANRIDWSRTQVFWGDERCVPPDNQQSNFHMAYDILLSKVPIPGKNIHRMRGELPPLEAAQEYDTQLRTVFPNEGLPHFDLIFLGMGTDGHTASLFPENSVLHETKKWVAAIYVKSINRWRITLTVPVLNDAEHVVVLVSGTEKAARLHDVLEGPSRPFEQPIQLVHARNELEWLVDETAAKLLDR